ncbi:MAG TPA: FIST N-terminal domain-containing protein [Methanocella sp.]|nr:FIST N-terminal domain-containing protein [Methanocella sp.]
MKLKSVYSTKSSADEVVSDISSQLKGFTAKVLIFFASSKFESSIGKKMQDEFRGVTVFGCTTAGEISSGRMIKNSVVAMALGPEIVSDVQVSILENIKGGVNAKSAFKSFENHFKIPVRQMDISNYIGMVLIDGLSGKEEDIMNQIGNLTDITFIGGSAGDDLKFKETRVYYGGKSYTNAALLALFQVKNGFDIIKTQSFKVLDKKLVVTKADEATRQVIEFDGKPAAQAYAAAVGTTVAEAPNHFMHNPVGLIIGDEPYVRSPQRLDDRRIAFYCHIPEDMEVSLLESTNIVDDTKEALAKAESIGPIAGIINFHCILRTLELEQKMQTEAYGNLFTGIPTIGFSTYGEEYIGHINQTSTMLVFR